MNNQHFTTNGEIVVLLRQITKDLNECKIALKSLNDKTPELPPYMYSWSDGKRVHYSREAPTEQNT